jgi:Flp pilus assembly protein CpaB
VGSRKIIMLVGSILIGALAGFALLNYVQGIEEETQQDVAPVKVWVVAETIEAGTTSADAIQTQRLQLREIDSDFRPDNAVLDTKQIEGRIAVATLARNQILVSGMFETPQEVATTFTDLIQPDHVAVSVTFPQNKAVAGFVKPGDFVDIIALGSAPTPGEGEEDVFDTSARNISPYQRPARFLYRAVRIIAVNSEVVGGQVFVDGPLEEDQPVAAGSVSLTFAVPPEAAQKILSVNESDLVLTLLPKQSDWIPTALPNIIPELILDDADLPGEDGNQVTPYGRDGFATILDEELESDSGELDSTDDATPGDTTGGS